MEEIRDGSCAKFGSIGKLECPTHLQETTGNEPGTDELKLTAVFEPAPEGEIIEEAKANLLDSPAQVMQYHRDEARKHAVPGALREEFQIAAS